MYKLMIVEDDRGIAEAVKKQAESWGLEALAVSDFSGVMDEFARFEPHIVLLDISLPFYNGYHWCGEIRKVSKVPVIFISSASDNMNIIMAMNMGADDFIAKPFDQSVLIAKIMALLRRSYDFAPSKNILTHKGAALDPGAGVLNYDGERIELTKNESRILLCLMESKGQTVSRERLMERLWDTDSFVDENTLTVNVNRLRKKLDKAGLSGFITTKFGVGYMIE
ncbi:MAG: response regulator transcription factor [Clostridia bacterium]|nr:response regulator transcription factor [Clostridia bacterium]